MELDLHRFDHQHQACLFNFFVRNAEASQHFDTPAFEVVQVLRIVHSALAIDFAIADTELGRMQGRCRGGFHSEMGYPFGMFPPRITEYAEGDRNHPAQECVDKWEERLLLGIFTVA